MAMYAMLIDVNLCVGCGACVQACKQENKLPDSRADRLSATDYTVLEQHGDDTWVRRMCMHCLHPSCASACPVGALKKMEEGPVVYDAAKCIGCRYCMVACPYKIPRYEWSSITPRVQKCRMCPERVLQGKPTACAEACPTGATSFGERTQLIAEAWRRIAAEPKKYAAKVYGLEEAGGACVLYIGPQVVLASVLPTNVPLESLPQRTWKVLSQIPTVVTVVGAGMLGVSWVINRRMTLRREAVVVDGDTAPATGDHQGQEEK
jgi:formate dehydrogenase iron-sulfur subunit